MCVLGFFDDSAAARTSTALLLLRAAAVAKLAKEHAQVKLIVAALVEVGLHRLPEGGKKGPVGGLEELSFSYGKRVRKD